MHSSFAFLYINAGRKSRRLRRWRAIYVRALGAGRRALSFGDGVSVDAGCGGVEGKKENAIQAVAAAKKSIEYVKKRSWLETQLRFTPRLGGAAQRAQI